MGLSRVAVGDVCRTIAQGSSCLPPSRRASVSASLRRDRAEDGGEGGIAPLRRDGGATLWALGRNPLGILERSATLRVAAGSPTRRCLDVSAATLHAEVLRVADVADPCCGGSIKMRPSAFSRLNSPSQKFPRLLSSSRENMPTWSSQLCLML